MMFVTWCGGLLITVVVMQLFCALLWGVSSNVSGYVIEEDARFSLHAGMAVISIVGYLLVSGGFIMMNAGGA